MTDALLYTLPQWFVFSALFAVVYGWIENKKAFRLVGLGIFILLGTFSAYIISSGKLAPDASVNLQSDTVPLAKRLFPAYLCFVATAFLAILSLLFDWKNKKIARTMIVVTGLVALAGFFVVVGITRSL